MPTAADKSPAAFAAYALAGGTATLDPAHRVNVRLGREGAGRVPPVVAIESGRRSATLQSEALQACVEVPVGWHALDDGRRLLIFDPSGEVQISLERVKEPEAEETVARLEAEAARTYPTAARRRRLLGEAIVLEVRGVDGGRAGLDQSHVIAPFRVGERRLAARVTTAPARGEAACILAALILDRAVAVPETGLTLR